MPTPQIIIRDYLRSIEQYGVFTLLEISNMTGLAIHDLEHIKQDIEVTLPVINHCFLSLPGIYEHPHNNQNRIWETYGQKKQAFVKDTAKIRELFTFIQKAKEDESNHNVKVA